MQADALKQFVAELLSQLGVETDSILISGTHRTVASVTTNESGRLIGESGETLRALNTIAKRMAEAKYGEEATNFIIDVNGYQEAQLEKVRNNARMLAQRARLFKHEVEMPPMSPYERLVVHELFAEDPEIETASAGEGKFRHIVLKYRQNATPSTN